MGLNKYISYEIGPKDMGIPKGLFLIIGFICLCILIKIQHPPGFRYTILLPIFYIFLTWLLVDKGILRFGIGTFAVIMFYCVRMCIFPTIIAMGHYYFEPPEDLYINFYCASVVLMGFENLTIYMVLRICVYKNIPGTPLIIKDCYRSHTIIKIALWVITIITLGTFFLKDIDYYHFITEESVEQFAVDEVIIEKHSGFFWYLSDYLSGLWRILLSSFLIGYWYKKYPKSILQFTLIVALINLLFLSDRRIFAVLVSLFCIFYYIKFFSNPSTKKFLLICIGVMLFVMAYYFGINYAEQGGMEMISRSIQRYFSGPSLSAFALRINHDIGTVPFEFYKLLHNDFQSLSGIFGKMNDIDFVDRYFPSKGIWTPFVPGALRYFGILFPIPLVLCGWCIVKWDCKSRSTNDYLYSMIYSYISFCIAFYLIMYSIELVFYFIIATGCVLTYLIHLDSKYRITLKIKSPNETSYSV